MIEKFDVVVVGAGPAGSRAAYAAAKEGLSVALLERHGRVGEHILCAEGISRNTIKGWLDVKAAWVATYLQGAVIVSPSGRRLTLNYPNVGYILKREIFDYELAQEAVNTGCRLMTGAEVTQINDHAVIFNQNEQEKRIRFHFLIAADGAESRVGRMIGLSTGLKLNEIHVCAQYRLANIKVDPSRAIFYLDNRYAPGGYTWVFPKSETTANAGLGLCPIISKSKPREYLDQWLKTEFPDATPTSYLVGAVPAKRMKLFSRDNCFIAGDAARLVNPISGAGIAYAVKSGYLAGLNAARLAKGKKSEYEKELRREMLEEISALIPVRNIYLRFTNQDFELVFDLLEDMFSNVVISDIDYRKIVRNAILFNPRFFKLGYRLLIKFLK